MSVRNGECRGYEGNHFKEFNKLFLGFSNFFLSVFRFDVETRRYLMFAEKRKHDFALNTKYTPTLTCLPALSLSFSSRFLLISVSFYGINCYIRTHMYI